MPVSPGPGRTVFMPVGNSGRGIELRWADKGLSESLPFAFDATNFLADLGGDSIATGTVQIASSPSDLTIGPCTATGSLLIWTMGGGSFSNPVADYCCTVSFSTVGGYTVSRNVWLRVWPLSPNRTFSTDLIVIEGPPGPNIATAAQVVSLQAGDLFVIQRQGVFYLAPVVLAGGVTPPSGNLILTGPGGVDLLGPGGAVLTTGGAQSPQMTSAQVAEYLAVQGGAVPSSMKA